MLLLLLALAAASAQQMEPRSYQIGTPELDTLWVSPANGNDASPNATQVAPLRTVREAWSRIPSSIPLTRGFAIMLLPGDYPEETLPTYWESRHGSAQHPVVISTAPGYPPVTLPNMNLYDCRYLYLMNLIITGGGGDVLHFEACNHLLLLGTLWLIGPERERIPEGSRAAATKHGRAVPRLLGGIGLVLRDRYLLLVALLVVLLNWINTTGEFILADYVQRDAEQLSAASGGALDPGVLIAQFYGNFQFWVTVTGLAIQLLLVARIYRTVGVRGALLVHPVVVAIGYGLLAFSPMLIGFVPIFTLIRLVKIVENATDYSLMNTTRQALFLPVDRDSKYDGKTAIDTFYWRVGDVIQAGVVYAGLNWFHWAAPTFAALNLLLATAWIVLAVMIGREFARKARDNVFNVAPVAGPAIDDLLYEPGRHVEHRVRDDAFHDEDEGDVLYLHARCADGRPLPRWLRFDARQRRFACRAPHGCSEEFTVVVVATDVDGLEASSTFVVRRSLPVA